MATRPHDLTDLYLAPVVLEVDARIEELGQLGKDGLAYEVALDSDSPDYTRRVREDGLIKLALGAYCRWGYMQRLLLSKRLSTPVDIQLPLMVRHSDSRRMVLAQRAPSAIAEITSGLLFSRALRFLWRNNSPPSFSDGSSRAG